MIRKIKRELNSYTPWLAIILFILVVSGCQQKPDMMLSQDAHDYEGVMDVSYEDALDPAGQLALGILQLADTPNAVTADQATLLRSLWELSQKTALRSDAERLALVSAIEGALQKDQISVIQSLRLTNGDALNWLHSQESRASAGAVTTELVRAVVELLEESHPATSDIILENMGALDITPTPTPNATGATEEPENAEPEPTTVPAVAETEDATPEPVEEVPEGQVDTSQTALSSGQEPTTSIVAPPALSQIQDTDPGPPFSVEITTNFAVSNPDLEEGWIYTVGGFVRNDSDQNYTLQAIHVTFYDADGFKGAFYPFASTGRGRNRGGEYIWHGRTEADFACLVIGPGQPCPFSVQIAAADMASFLIHPDAAIVEWHEVASAEVRNTSLTDDGLGYLRISGTVHNPNTYPIKQVMVSGALLDNTGQWASFGTAILPESIEPGMDKSFTVWVEKAPHVDYAVFFMAEGDFN